MEQSFPPGGAQWPPPQGWVPQPVPAPPARKPRWLLFGGIAGLVLVLLAGLTTWLLWPSKAGREPFEQALAGLSSAPAVRNSTSTVGGMIKTDVKTTAYGETSGTLSFQGKKIDILVVGGKVYFKAPDGMLPGAMADAGGTDELKDRWMTGEDALFGPALQQFESPEKLAARLRAALDQADEIPGDQDETVRDVPALKASTPAGDLYVSKEAPHRLLRYSVKMPGGIPSMPSLPRIPTLPSVAPRPAAEQQSPGGLGESDVDALSPEDTDAVYDDLMANARKLTSAVDTGVRFDVNGSATVSCGAGGCTVTANVSNSASANSGGKVTGQVNATMTANVTIDGRPAGSCQSATTLPVNGAGSVSCVNGAAGGVFASVEAQKKADAEARSRAAGGVPVQYQIQSIAAVSVLASAIGQVEVTRIVDDLGQRRDAVNNCGRATNSFAAGTRVLMADRTARAIEGISPGDRILAVDPYTGRQVEVPVLARIVGHGEKLLYRLTVRGGEVTATDNHLFWDPEKRAWVEAAWVRPGQALSTSDGAQVRVETVRSYEDDTSVFNLSVAGPHTFQVLAGPTSVLVHNQGGELDPLKFFGDYTGRIDRFDTAGRSEFEIHVYYKGVEYGFFGSNGWFPKHGLPVPTNPPAQLESVLKGYAIDYMRRSQRLKPDDDIKGDAWKRARVARGNC
ncbi:Hint domain-containing protein [Amycolatopsis coloradensis]|uniref:Hint domain-containing protein n=1 Tax=Amycolatopsis coloradensis TaxID=76021 RepID=A0ACD5BPP4_9PSEU